MNLLAQDENIQFVIQPYRERLSNHNWSLLKKEILFLAQQHGQNVRLFKQVDGHIEAVFSHDHGYLLAESVYHYFGKPTDLIYCEELPDKVNALVVIIRASNIFFSGKLPINTIFEEFQALLTLKNKFAIFIYGNIPISIIPYDIGKMIFDADHVASFNRLEKSVLPLLPINANLKLLPVGKLITHLNVKRYLKRFTIIMILVLAFIAIYFWFNTSYIEFKKTHQLLNSYYRYQTALMTPAPSQQLLELYSKIHMSYTLPGWEIHQISYQNQQLRLDATSFGGTFALLDQWAKKMNARVIWTPQNIQLVIKSKIPNRTLPMGFMNVQEATSYIIDAVILSGGDDSVQIKAIKAEGMYKAINLTIKFNQTAPIILKLLSLILEGFPVVLNKFNVYLKNGFLTGSLQLTVLGN